MAGIPGMIGMLGPGGRAGVGIPGNGLALGRTIGPWKGNMGGIWGSMGCGIMPGWANMGMGIVGCID